MKQVNYINESQLVTSYPGLLRSLVVLSADANPFSVKLYNGTSAAGTLIAYNSSPNSSVVGRLDVPIGFNALYIELVDGAGTCLLSWEDLEYWRNREEETGYGEVGHEI